MRLITLLYLSILLFSITANGQLPKGDRTLAWQIDLAENNDYDLAFAYGYQACMESTHLFATWTDFEPDTGVYNPAYIAGFLDVIDIYYPIVGVEVELQIAPVNTGILELPSELVNHSFDDPEVIDQFKVLLDTVFAHIPNVTLSALNIGNEGDYNFGTDPQKYAEYGTFLNAVSTHAKDLYFDLHGTELKVGTVFTFDGLTNEATAELCKSVNNELDVISTTYYPLNNDFTMEDPDVVSEDFASLVAEYPDTNRPIYFVECGYASSTLCNSSESQQANFWSEVFTAWDSHYDNIKHLTVFKSTDWSADQVNELSQYYNVQDTVFKEYLRTLGVRTWPGDGTNKEAYEQLRCELETREWCDVTCTLNSVNEGNSTAELLLYPVPANASIIFEGIQSQSGPLSLHLFDMQGRRVRALEGIQQHRLEIRREQLPAGVYAFRFTGKEGIVHQGQCVFE